MKYARALNQTKRAELRLLLPERILNFEDSLVFSQYHQNVIVDNHITQI
jgi:hypothetical protein